MVTLEHVGIAIEDAESVRKLWALLLRQGAYKSEGVESEGVRTHFLAAGRAGAPKLELLEATTPGSPIAKHLERRGAGLHHLAFEVADIEQAHRDAEAAGLRPLTDPKPGADGKRIFFLHPKATAGVLVELCQSVPTPLRPAFAERPDGGRVAIYELGAEDAPPLVLLHGVGGTVQSELEALARRLETRFRVIALDFTGHGASGDPHDAAPLSFDVFTTDVLAALTHLGLKRAHVFGFSMGGAAALMLASQRPERVGRLAVHATNLHWTPELVAPMTARLDPDALAARGHTEVLQTIHGKGWPERFRALQAYVRTLPAFTSDNGDALREVQAPVLVSGMDRDALFGRDATLRVHEQLPNARLALFPGRRHAAEALPLDSYVPLLTDWLLAS